MARIAQQPLDRDIDIVVQDKAHSTGRRKLLPSNFDICVREVGKGLPDSTIGVLLLKVWLEGRQRRPSSSYHWFATHHASCTNYAPSDTVRPAAELPAQLGTNALEVENLFQDDLVRCPIPLPGPIGMQK